MNAVAQLLLADGARVTGSDRFFDQGVDLPVFHALRAMGLELVPQDGSALSPATTALVLSTAVEADNPERVRARSLGVPERHRSEILAGHTKRGRLVAVAGTSGKTTCCGWLGRVFEACGLDPCVVNGGGILDWKSTETPGNVRGGRPDGWWVVEVDESDKSLLRFHPEIAMITSVTPDHFGKEETVALFRDFARQVRGTVVCGPGVREVLEDAPGVRAELLDVGDPLPSHLPGDHNGLNAAAVARVAEACGVPREKAVGALGGFRGVERRLELCSPPGRGPRVYDDYAHNPEKISAAIRATRPADGRLVVLWRPHGFAPLAQNFEALADAFAQNLRQGDEAWILPVFYAGGTAPRGVGSDALVQAIQSRGGTARALDAYPDAVPLEKEDVLLVMGARDPELPRFASRIGQK